MYRIGVDLGGTTIAAGIVNEEKRLIAQAGRKTRKQASPEQMADDIKELLERLLKESGAAAGDVLQAGVGVPGSVNADGVIEDANNIGFYNVPFRKLLSERLPFPVTLCNDAKAAALGEYLAGAGKGAAVFQMVTLGTGIGGALIVNGTVLEGCNFAAGEVGHMVIRAGGLACNCGRTGCFEQYASASALMRLAKDRAQENKNSALYRLYASAPERFSGKGFFSCLSLGDALAKDVFAEYIGYLAEGIVNLINILQPDILCLGGGISAQGEVLLAPLRQAVKGMVYSANSAVQTKLCAAELANAAGMIGAAYCEK